MAVSVMMLFVPEVFAIQGKIAYLAHANGFWQVWTMDADGSYKKKITSAHYDKSHINWYPDGVHLLVNGNQGKLRKVNTDTKTETPINLPIEGTVDAAISPDGKHIAFSLSVADSIDNNHIWLVNSEGKNLVKLTNMAGLQHEPVWSLDSKWIYFLSGKGKQAHDIWRVSVKNKLKEKLTAGNLYHFDLAFSNQGDMAFSNNRTGNYEIWIKNKAGKETALTNNPSIDSRPSFSSSGKDIVFESSRGGIMNIWRKSVTNGKTVRLTNEKIGARYPVWWQKDFMDEKND